TTEPISVETIREETIPTVDRIFTPSIAKPTLKSKIDDKVFELTQEISEMKFNHDNDPQIISLKKYDIIEFNKEDEFYFQVDDEINVNEFTVSNKKLLPMRICDEIVFEINNGEINEVGLVKQMYFTE
ncbi:hypothetical protein H311_04837, partial [Anncaliia algerae PRA109]